MFCKGLIVNILHFLRHTVSVATTPPGCGMKAAVDSIQTNEMAVFQCNFIHRNRKQAGFGTSVYNLPFPSVVKEEGRNKE